VALRSIEANYPRPVVAGDQGGETAERGARDQGDRVDWGNAGAATEPRNMLNVIVTRCRVFQFLIFVINQ
jgi:hypothetical protein